MNLSFDTTSDAYLRFISLAWHELVERVEPMEEGKFWKLIAKIDWPNRCQEDYLALAREHAARVGLRDAARCYLTAVDIKDDLAFRFEDEDSDIAELIPSEDGVEDFLYHLVGQGRAFVESLEDDLAAGLEIAEDGSYVESLRYVLEGANRYYPIEEYLAIFSGGQEPPELAHPPQPVGSLVLVSGLPALVVRHDKNSVHVVTPIDARDVQLVK